MFVRALDRVKLWQTNQQTEKAIVGVGSMFTMLCTLTGHLIIGIWTQRDTLPQKSLLFDNYFRFLGFEILAVTPAK